MKRISLATTHRSTRDDAPSKSDKLLAIQRAWATPPTRWLASLAVLFLLFSTALQAQLKYSISGGKATVTGYTGTLPSTINIPATYNTYPVTSIGGSAFYECRGLKAITIPSSVTSIGENAFMNCLGLTSVSIPSTVITLGNGAFFACHGLMSITIPTSMTSIGGNAFEGCSSLASVTIPSSVTSIGCFAFGNCDGLNAIIVSPSNPNYSSLDGILFNKNKSSIIQFPCGSGLIGNYSIPSSVISIEEGAFYDCNGLTGVTIPPSVTSIGLSAFSRCSRLTNISIPSSVSRIENHAFDFCIALTSITIPSSATSIGCGAFFGCSSLTSVTIPSSIASIGEYAFGGCNRLTKATFLGNAPIIVADMPFTTPDPRIFYGAASGFTVYYHNGRTGFTTPTWNGYPTVCIENPPTLAQLAVTGPTSIPWGEVGYYTATYSYPGGPAEDVTNQCEWSVTGGPTVTSAYDTPKMQWNMLDPKVVSTVPLLVFAKITRNNSRIASNTVAVTVTQGTRMSIGIGLTDLPRYVEKSGRNFVWRFGADTYGQATYLSGVTYIWYLDGVQIATGPVLNQNYTGLPGTKNLKVIATDPQGRTGECVRPYVFDAPPVGNEPNIVPVLDPILADLKDENGQTFAFDLQKTPNGLVVVTHGLFGSSSDLWLKTMAMSIKNRLVQEGKPLPNIIALGWHDLATPSEFSRKYLDNDPLLPDFVTDLTLIKPYGLELGFGLADWLKKQVYIGNVSASAPVHLIGHSAGGFVVGECGYRLNTTLSNVRVSMLDTPLPELNHLSSFPGAGRKLDRYVSSAYGMMITQRVEPSDSYSYVFLGPGPYPLRSGHTYAHSYAHVWYEASISIGEVGAQGFGWSPFLSTSGGASAPLYNDPMVPKGAPPLSPAPPLQSDTPITGFTTFGTVSAVTDGFLLTEGDQANSGLVLKNYDMPVGAQSINFHFQFTGAGDGDYLVVSHGETVIGFGSDNDMSESQEITMNMPVEHVAGHQGDLIFRLISRENQNAMVTLTGITITSVDDADMDTLTNAQEAVLGTNPLLADSDGDGINDATELNTTHTNPMMADSDGDGASDGSEVAAGTDALDGSSRFVVNSSVKTGADFTVTWSSVPGKQYRIVRSTEPSFGTYDVVRSGIAAEPPQQSFTDSGGASESRMFYRVELEP